MTRIFVVGGHGYVGSRISAAAAGSGDSVQLVSRIGGIRFGLASSSWPDFLHEVPGCADARVIWLLDGSSDDEPARLAELLGVISADAFVVAVSTCTVYGDRGDQMCTEDMQRQLLSGHARVKAGVEDALAAAQISSCVLRLGALYGVDERGVRPDRIQKWVSAGRRVGVITVPDPDHWRGWLHRDQAARALHKTAAQRIEGVFNAATANLTFAQAAEAAARATGAIITGDEAPDPCSYRVDSQAAVVAGLLDVRVGESIGEATAAFIGDTQ